MFCKLFVPVFLLLAFAAHSTLSVITSMKAPQGALTPGKTFTVTLFTKPPKKDEFCTVFGLHPGKNPLLGDELGETLLKCTGCCLL